MRFRSIVQDRYLVVAVNSSQLQHAKTGIEGIGFYEISVMDFLDLTSDSEAQKNRILKETKGKTPKPDWDSSVIHPFLYVDEDGKIDGHEGRHRAASAYHPGQRRFRIVIAARDAGWPVDKWGWRWKRQLPVPPTLHGQFRPVTHKVDLAHFEEIKRP